MKRLRRRATYALYHGNAEALDFTLGVALIVGTLALVGALIVFTPGAW